MHVHVHVLVRDVVVGAELEGAMEVRERLLAQQPATFTHEWHVRRDARHAAEVGARQLRSRSSSGGGEGGGRVA